MFLIYDDLVTHIGLLKFPTIGNRFLKFERKDWRVSYNSLIVLENLLTHGPESVAAEFENDKEVIEQMGGFQYIDEKGSVILI